MSEATSGTLLAPFPDIAALTRATNSVLPPRYTFVAAWNCAAPDRLLGL